MNQLQLFHVERIDDGGYDSYDSFVICCENENVARNTHPGSEIFIWWDDESYSRMYDSWVQPEMVSKLIVEFLGIADAKIPKGIICASFNAG